MKIKIFSINTFYSVLKIGNKFYFRDEVYDDEEMCDDNDERKAFNMLRGRRIGDISYDKSKENIKTTIYNI